MDCLSKLAHFIPTVDSASAEDVARLFIDNIFALHGMPQRIVSDRNTRFTGSFWSSMCQLWGCEHQLSTAYHPQTDGQTVRVNRTLEDMLRHWCSPHQDDWDLYLKLAEFAYNNAHHESLGTTPVMLTFGQHPHTPATLLRQDSHGKLRNPSANQFQAEMLSHVHRAKQFQKVLSVGKKPMPTRSIEPTHIRLALMCSYQPLTWLQGLLVRVSCIQSS